MSTITKRTAKNGAISFKVEVRLKGYPAQRATFARKSDAKKWSQDIESAIRQGRHFKTAESKKHTFAELADRYINDVLSTKPLNTATQQHQQLDWWTERLGGYVLADITPALIVQCRDELASGITFRHTKRSPATVVRYLSVLSHAFTTAVNEWQWLESSPMRGVKRPKEPRGRVRFLDDGERERLLIACQQSRNKLLYPCVIIALSTGMRYGELMGLRWPDVDLKVGSTPLTASGAIILHETKSGERRRVPLAGMALELMREHAKVRRLDTDLLFPSPSDPKTPMDLRKAFETALDRAAIDDFRWHDLRHCTASYLAMNGASLAEIAEILGHKTLSMARRYAHFSESHISGVVAAMNEKMFG